MTRTARLRTIGLALLLMLPAASSCSLLEPEVNQDTAQAELLRVLGIWKDGKYYSTPVASSVDGHDISRFFDAHLQSRHRLNAYNIDSVTETRPGRFAFATTLRIESPMLPLPGTDNRQTVKKTYFVYLGNKEKFWIKWQDWVVVDERMQAEFDRLMNAAAGANEKDRPN
jgi:hypothetical protein